MRIQTILALGAASAALLGASSAFAQQRLACNPSHPDYANQTYAVANTAYSRSAPAALGTAAIAFLGIAAQHDESKTCMADNHEIIDHHEDDRELDQQRQDRLALIRQQQAQFDRDAQSYAAQTTPSGNSCVRDRTSFTGYRCN